MRRLPVLFGAVMLGLAFLVSASESQEGKKTAGKIKGQLPAGFKDLNVSAEQKAKIYGIQTDYRAKVADLEKKIKELKGQEAKDVFAVLTKAQQEQYLKSKGIETPPAKTKKEGDKKAIP